MVDSRLECLPVDFEASNFRSENCMFIPGFSQFRMGPTPVGILCKVCYCKCSHSRALKILYLVYFQHMSETMGNCNIYEPNSNDQC